MDGENPLTLVRDLVSRASRSIPVSGDDKVAALLEERTIVRKQLDKLYKSIIHSFGGKDAVLMADELHKLQAENKRMKQDLALLQRGSKEYSTLRRDDLCLLLAKAETDLNKALDGLAALKREKKDLVSQKDTLLEQLKILHDAVEDRNKQMSSYVAQFNEEFEQRKQQNEEKKKELTQENKALEKERWDLMKKAKKLGEDKVVLGRAVEQKEQRLQLLERELEKCRSELEETLASSQVAHEEQESEEGRRSVDMVVVENGSNCDVFQNSQSQSQSFEGQLDTVGLHGNKGSVKEKKKKKKDNKGSTRGSLSRIFGSKVKTSDSDNGSVQTGYDNALELGLPQQLTPEHQEHWKLFLDSKHLPLNQWKGPAIAAWIELAIGMAPYAQACRENIKSGRMAADMSQSEFERVLGISNPLHKRKLRLALEDQKNPNACRYPHAGAVDHIWVSQVWCHEIGLSQHSDGLFGNLVDGRVLESITKEDIKKHLKIQKRVEQMSILTGVELLRTHLYQREILNEQRQFSKNPVYWTNEQVREWLIDIDLKEYADNVINSGVHGALLYFEQSNFTADMLSSILDIPHSKLHVKKYLHTELNALLTGPQEEDPHAQDSSRKTATVSVGSMHRTSSDATIDQVDRGEKARWSLRGVPKREKKKKGDGTIV